MVQRILLLEDDKSLGETLEGRLSEAGYVIDWVMTCEAAYSSAQQHRYACALIDIGLPDGSGFDVAREIVQRSTTPVIFLTAMNSAEYRLEGFEIGAVDYIPKPFHLKELLLRIQRVLGDAKVRQYDNIKLLIDVDTVEIDGEKVTLPNRDFELLCFLFEQSPKVLSRDEILKKVFKSEETTTPRVVDNAIVRIRSALGPAREELIRSVRGQGYQCLYRATTRDLWEQ